MKVLASTFLRCLYYGVSHGLLSLDISYDPIILYSESEFVCLPLTLNIVGFVYNFISMSIYTILKARTDAHLFI